MRSCITRRGNEWAPLFAEGGTRPRPVATWGSRRASGWAANAWANEPIKNCTPVSAEFRESFADATVERVVVDGHHATAEFSNGESVEFDGQKADGGDRTVAGSVWFIPEKWIKEVARRNFEP